MSYATFGIAATIDASANRATVHHDGAVARGFVFHKQNASLVAAAEYASSHRAVINRHMGFAAHASITAAECTSSDRTTINRHMGRAAGTGQAATEDITRADAAQGLDIRLVAIWRSDATRVSVVAVAAAKHITGGAARDNHLRGASHIAADVAAAKESGRMLAAVDKHQGIVAHAIAAATAIHGTSHLGISGHFIFCPNGFVYVAQMDHTAEV